MLDQAVLLKQIIDMIPDNVEPIGRCYEREHPKNINLSIKNNKIFKKLKEIMVDNDDNSSYDSDNGSSDSDNNKDSDSDICDIIDGLTDLACDDSYHAGHINIDNIKLKVNIGSSYKLEHNFKLKQKHLKQLYDVASEATFGNLKNMTTEINHDIRMGRDLTSEQFEIDTSLCNQLEKIWSIQYRTMNKIKVVPYKINLYTDGGHFKTHKDTSDLNMIGTILVSLHDRSVDNKGGIFVVQSVVETTQYDSEQNECINIFEKYEWIPEKSGDYIMFYSDCPHELSPIEGDWYRGVVSFKVYCENNDEPRNYDYDDTYEAKQLLSHMKTPFGMITKYDYSLQNTNNFKGHDEFTYNLLKVMDFKFHVIPVCVHHTGESNMEGKYDNDSRLKINVYPLTSEVLDDMKLRLDKKYKWKSESFFKYKSEERFKFTIQEIDTNDINFYYLNKGYCWTNKNESFIGYVGNESQPENINSIYLHWAFIVY